MDPETLPPMLIQTHSHKPDDYFAISLTAYEKYPIAFGE